jgi:hypothetical protein
MCYIFERLRLLLRLASATHVLPPSCHTQPSIGGLRSVGGSDGGILPSIRAIAIT